MKRVALFLVLLCVTLTTGVLSAQAVAPGPVVPVPELTTTDASAWLDGLMPYAVAQGDIAGAVVVIVKDNQILVSKGYGYADLATRKPIDPATTLFRPGSVSKLFVWTSVMQLVEQGKLDLDKDVNAYLDFTIPPREGQPITLRHLMTHTPGFEETVKNLIISDPHGMTSDAEWLKAWVPERVYAPGEVAAYSNYGAALAGYIVERTSGQPFDAYVEQHIFQPLGMRHATFRQPLPESLQRDVSTGYLRASAAARPFELVVPAPAGSLSASGDDMARFMLAHLNGGSYDGGQILHPETTTQMHEFIRESIPGLPAMALGFYHMDQGGQVILGHDGNTELFHSRLALIPAQNVGLFVSINGGDAGGGDHLRQALLQNFVQRYFPQHLANEPTLPTAREHGALLAGRYVSSRVSLSNFLSVLNLLSQPTVVLQADGTLLTPEFKNVAGKPRHWREVRPFVWRDVDGNGLLGAAMDGNTVRWLSISDASPVVVFRPVPWRMSAGWNLPLLYGTLLVWLVALVMWPVAPLVRRHYRARCPLDRSALRWYRYSRLAALASVLFFAGWVWVLGKLGDSIGNMTTALDGSLRGIQLCGVLAVLGCVGCLGNAWHAWRASGNAWRKVNSLILVLASMATLWFTFSLHLLNLHLNY